MEMWLELFHCESGVHVGTVHGASDNDRSSASSTFSLFSHQTAETMNMNPCEQDNQLLFIFYVHFLLYSCTAFIRMKQAT